MHFDQPLSLESGGVLLDCDIAHEIYGTLNAERSNAILVCHALSGSHHAAGYHHADDRKPGWWDNMIGPGKVLDSDRLFIVSSNNLGGCYGTTGSATGNPHSGRHNAFLPPIPQYVDVFSACMEKMERQI